MLMKLYEKILVIATCASVILCNTGQWGHAAEKEVTGRGEAAVVNITPEEGKIIALQRARADAIEKAVGIGVHGTTVVTNGKLVGQFLQTYSRGYITKEQEMLTKGWLDTTPKYTYDIIATVVIPEKKIEPGFVLFTSWKDNKAAFLEGENAVLKIRFSMPAHIGVFNLRADDSIVMLYPNKYCALPGALAPNADWIFPDEKSGIVLTMATFPGHRRDSEAFFVVAIKADGPSQNCFATLYEEGKPYKVTEFFARYSKVAETAVEQIMPYEVLKKGNE
jgi:hypothetical protein